MLFILLFVSTALEQLIMDWYRLKLRVSFIRSYRFIERVVYEISVVTYEICSAGDQDLLF